MNISQILSQATQLRPYVVNKVDWSDRCGNRGLRTDYNFENGFGAILIDVEGGKSNIQIIKFDNPELSILCKLAYLSGLSGYYFNRSYNSYTCVNNTIINEMYPNLKNLDYEDCIKILNKILRLNSEGTKICEKTYRQKQLLKIEKEKDDEYERQHRL